MKEVAMNDTGSTSKKKWKLKITATDWASLIIYTIIVSAWVFYRDDISNSQISQLNLHKDVCQVLSAAGIPISLESNGTTCMTTLPYQQETILMKYSAIYYPLGGKQQELHVSTSDVISAKPIDTPQ
jgi:hypothetical protein